MAVRVVESEPFSDPFSLLTGSFAGRLLDLGLPRLICVAEVTPVQQVAGNSLPVMNRESLSRNKEIAS